MVVALLLLPRRRVALPLAALAFAGLLFTFSRSSFLALAGGLVVLALASRDLRPAALAAVVVGVAIGWAHVFPSVGPTGHWTKADLVQQRRQARSSGPASGSALSDREPSLHEHWLALKEGVRPEAIDVVRSKGSTESLKPRERTIIELVRSLYRQHRIPDELFKAALDEFGRERLIELVVLAGHYGLLGFVLNGFEVDIPVTAGATF